MSPQSRRQPDDGFLDKKRNELSDVQVRHRALIFRISAFELLSDFGFRIFRSPLRHPIPRRLQNLPFPLRQALNAMLRNLVENRIHLAADEFSFRHIN